MKLKTKPEGVRVSVPKGDGTYLVVTLKGNGGSSPVPIPEGARVLIADGKAERVP